MTTYRDRLNAGEHTEGSAAHLKSQLKQLGLSTAGNKDEQQKRLDQASKGKS